VILWPHQAEAIEVCTRSFRRRDRSRTLVQFPTGTGKTEVAVRVALEFVASASFHRCLIAVSSDSVLQQFYKRLCSATALPVALDKAEAHARTTAKIIVGSRNSLWGRLAKYPADTLLIDDECHHSNYEARENLRIVQRFQHVVGLSATPWTEGCIKVFGGGEKVFLSLSAAVRQELVCPFEILPWTEPTGPLGLVYCDSNAEAARCSLSVPGSTWIGINSGFVAQRVTDWLRGNYRVLFANRMLTEGFDCPRLDRVWLNKSTNSLLLLVQCAGRALRVQPGKRASIYCSHDGTVKLLEVALLLCDQPPLLHSMNSLP
jgi:superfamily II DNA or RNA helicase